MRGLHVFAKALPRLLAEVPDAQVLIFGRSNDRPYGGSPPDGRSWRDVCFDGVAIDPERVHFVGKAPHEEMLAALRLSTAHVYYTYPFVLSWSLVEAMASGCYVIGSDTAPMHDAIEDGVNGRLLPFFDVEALSSAMIEACRNPEGSAPLRAAAPRHRRRQVLPHRRPCGLAGAAGGDGPGDSAGGLAAADFLDDAGGGVEEEVQPLGTEIHGHRTGGAGDALLGRIDGDRDLGARLPHQALELGGAALVAGGLGRGGRRAGRPPGAAAWAA